MSAVPETESSQQTLKEANEGPSFNIYPLLGIALMIALAAVAYGGLLLFLFEEWLAIEPAVQGAPRN